MGIICMPAWVSFYSREGLLLNKCGVACFDLGVIFALRPCIRRWCLEYLQAAQKGASPQAVVEGGDVEGGEEVAFGLRLQLTSAYFGLGQSLVE